MQEVQTTASASESRSEMPKKPKKPKKAYFKLFGTSYKKCDSLVGLGFILPACILGILFIFIPIAISLTYAFTDMDFTDVGIRAPHFIGFENFRIMFAEDKIIWKALGNTFLFVVVAVPFQLAVALGLALILNKKKLRCNTFFRWAFFMPVMLSLAVTSFLWINLVSRTGLVTVMLEKIGFNMDKLLLENPNTAMGVIIFVSVWQGAGYQMLIFLSGLKNIPPELYEAASLDGASPSKMFFSITLPAIKPTFSFVAVTTLIGAFKLITQPMIMTQGGPDNSTYTMSYFIYDRARNGGKGLGYSSAVAFFYTIVMAAIALVLRKITSGDNTEAK